MVGPQFSSDCTADGPRISIISSNITSLRKNWNLLKQQEATLYCLQETTLNRHGQNAMAREFIQQGFHSLFGKACDFKFSGSQKRISLWNATSGGLCTVSKQFLPIQNIPSTTSPFQIGRCQHSWVPTGIGNRGFHIFNVYGFVGAGPKNPHAFRLNEQLLTDIFQCAFLLGDVPWIVLGDMQIDTLSSPTLGSLLQGGSIYDLGQLYTNSDWTYSRNSRGEHIKTRIDLALCNQNMLAHVTNMSIIRDSGLPGHCPLKIQLDYFHQLDYKFIYRLPKTFHDLSPLEDCKMLDDIERSIWQSYEDSFHAALVDGDVHTAYSIWCSTAGKCLLHLARLQGQTTHKRHNGRGAMPKVVKTLIQATPASHDFGASSILLSSLLKLLRQFEQLKKKLPCAHDFQSLAGQQFSLLCKNISKAYKRLLHTTIASYELCHLDKVKIFTEQVNVAISTEQQNITSRRQLSFKQRLIQDWNGYRKSTYAWVRDAPPFMTPFFQTERHQFATRIKKFMK